VAESTLFIPLAHLGHYLWIFYVIPVAIVVASILKTTISEKRRARVTATQVGERSGPEDDSPAGGAGRGPRTDTPARPQAPSL
jgi:hypothetical protein